MTPSRDFLRNANHNVIGHLLTRLMRITFVYENTHLLDCREGSLKVAQSTGQSLAHRLDSRLVGPRFPLASTGCILDQEKAMALQPATELNRKTAKPPAKSSFLTYTRLFLSGMFDRDFAAVLVSRKVHSNVDFSICLHRERNPYRDPGN